ncbi:AAA family ATPase [Porphyromonas levii]|uniref:ATP-binding protein n=1 Tax=Porphyromonas levii TaxID=28114 RepID=A0A4Y8WTK5_9PORP|nr:AAA family ATPase [Porphyromonas levii]TFH97339.1 ATP-binding protein [Porphyromonas levii]TFH97451.1 ATP-binding protein [Porphyromonas levii]
MSSILRSDMCLPVGDKERAEEKFFGLALDSTRSILCAEKSGNASLVCLRGTRGIGKTYQLVQLGKILSEHEPKAALYVNLNHFYFSNHSIYHFAQEYRDSGGRVLLLDQIFKYPGWDIELAKCHRDFPDLRIVFTASSMMTLEEDYPELKGKVVVCDLYGFSFRQYLNYHHSLDFPAVTMEELVHHHEQIAHDISKEVIPMDDFARYMRNGYYPPTGDLSLFGEGLVRNMNMLLEVDLVYIRQIAPTYLPKLRKLLYLIGQQKDGITNVSSLSSEIDTSRATVMNYLKYLSDARMVRLIYKDGGEYPRKPDRVYLNDTNILTVMKEGDMDFALRAKIFFLQSVQDAGLHVELSEENGVDFLVDGKYPVRCFNKGDRRRSSRPDVIHALCGKYLGEGLDIPIWLFGFLY